MGNIFNNVLLKTFAGIVVYLNEKINDAKKTRKLLSDITGIILDLNSMTRNNTANKILKMKITIQDRNGAIKTTISKAILDGKIEKLKDWLESFKSGDMS